MPCVVLLSCVLRRCWKRRLRGRFGASCPVFGRRCCWSRGWRRGLRGWGFGGAWFLGLGCGFWLVFGWFFVLVNCCCLVIIGLFSTSEEVGDTLATDFILYGLEVMVCGLKRVRLHLTLSLTDVTQASCPIYLCTCTLQVQVQVACVGPFCLWSLQHS